MAVNSGSEVFSTEDNTNCTEQIASCKDDPASCSNPDRHKRRGQRGRHAHQKREFLESSDSELKSLISKVYGEPTEVLKEVKRQLLSLPPEQRGERAMLVYKSVKKIGEKVQRCRPDNLGQRAPPQPAPLEEVQVCTLDELDGRVKWLVGTMHLLIKKLQKAGRGEPEITQQITSLLEECKTLPNIALGLPPDEEEEQLQGEIIEQPGSELLEKVHLPEMLDELPDSCQFLRKHIEYRVRQALRHGVPVEEVEEHMDAVGSTCGLLDKQIKEIPDCFLKVAEKGIQTEVLRSIADCGLAAMPERMRKFA